MRARQYAAGQPAKAIPRVAVQAGRGIGGKRIAVVIVGVGSRVRAGCVQQLPGIVVCNQLPKTNLIWATSTL